VKVGGSFGYNNSRFTDYPGCTVAVGQTINCKGSKPVYSPKWTANARLDVDQPVGGGLALLANAEWAYRSSQFFSTWNRDVAPGVPVYSEKGFSLVNGFIGVGSEDGRWQALLWTRNLLNKKYETGEMQGQGGSLYFLGDPRTYGVRLTFGF
jgi:iron complex outermembrane receptor protein